MDEINVQTPMLTIGPLVHFKNVDFKDNFECINLLYGDDVGRTLLQMVEEELHD